MRKTFLVALVLTSSSWSGFCVGGFDLYTIKSQSSGKCVDIEGRSTLSRANIMQAACNGSASQLWFLYDDPKTTTIDENFINNFHSHYYFDMGSRTDHSPNIVQAEAQFDDQGAGAQFISRGQDIYSISAWYGRDRCVSASPDSNIEMGSCDDSQEQNFVVEKVEQYQVKTSSSGYALPVMIKNKKTQMILDQKAERASYSQGIRVIQADEGRRGDNSRAHLWVISQREAGPYGIRFMSIKNGHGINVLDVADRGNMDSVVLWREVYPRPNQLWMIMATGDRDQSYYIKAKSDLTECLGVNDAGKVYTLSCSGSDAQKWFIQDVES